MNKSILISALAIAAAAPFAQAQAPGAQGQVVVGSTPGKAAAVATVEVTGTVVAVDKGSRTVTLKGPQRTVDVVAGPEAKNFDQVRVGDRVSVTYVEALTLELKKTKAPLDMKADAGAVAAPVGASPAGAVGQQVTALADVIAVDPKKSTITLKGPRGNVFELNVRNKDHFKVVKKGDQVEVVYTQALAMAFTPVAKDAAKKK
jgi:hypothetical protein